MILRTKIKLRVTEKQLSKSFLLVLVKAVDQLALLVSHQPHDVIRAFLTASRNPGFEHSEKSSNNELQVKIISQVPQSFFEIAIQDLLEQVVQMVGCQ